MTDTLVLRAPWAITMDDSSGAGPAGVVEDAGVVLRGERLVEVGPWPQVRSAHPEAEVEDLADHVLMPGLVNAHSHLAMTMFRGVADDRDLDAFLARVIPLEAELLVAERVRDATRAAVVESHLAGVTTIVDMYFFCDAALEAARECAGRVLTGPVLFDGEMPDGPLGGWDDRLRWAGRWLRDHPATTDGVPLLGPHSVYTVSPEHLRDVAQLAQRSGTGVHVHAAETEAEVELVRSRHGMRPVELLDRVGLLGPGTILAHGVHLDDAEIDRIVATGAAVTHCPASNLKLASGVAPVRTLLERGAVVALGTDGPASSNDLDLLGAVRLAALAHKTVGPEGADAASLPAADVLRMATVGGARAAGLEGHLGVLAAGAVADVVAVDLGRPHTVPVRDPVSAVVYAAGRGDVAHVWSRGERVVRGGTHQKVDEAAVVADLRRLGRDVGAALSGRGEPVA